MTSAAAGPTDTNPAAVGGSSAATQDEHIDEQPRKPQARWGRILTWAGLGAAPIAIGLLAGIWAPFTAPFVALACWAVESAIAAFMRAWAHYADRNQPRKVTIDGWGKLLGAVASLSGVVGIIWAAFGLTG
ncbi:MAG: hypothetical protein NT132_04125 [Microbacterium sp.]|uniref:hypothetical protein n=1 Tax=Microbacterium sp. TaxID=51671 RepID=UPI0026058E6D|nr:hypothetical protein [Microbacterium sp.]MCX6501587.1 hypothetical protein [Microbacterium sp.]